jgi:hypothetical protein
MDKSTALWVLAKLEKRRHEYGNKPSESDYSYRVAQAILAEAAGFRGRIEWTDALKADGYEVYP